MFSRLIGDHLNMTSGLATFTIFLNFYVLTYYVNGILFLAQIITITIFTGANNELPPVYKSIGTNSVALWWIAYSKQRFGSRCARDIRNNNKLEDYETESDEISLNQY